MYFTHPQFKNFSFKPLLGDFSEIDLRNKLSKIFPDSHIVFTNSGRSAFQIAVNKLGLSNSEMIVPAYICDIFKPIFKHYNIEPIFIDVDLKTFNMEVGEIEDKITPNTKSILVCHTYGIPNDMDRIKALAEKYNLKIIEDCAHMPFGLPRAESREDALFFSFAKLFPVINGGMLISKKPVNIKLKNYRFKLTNIIKFLRLFPVLAILSELFRGKQRESRGNQEEIQRASRGCLRVVNYYFDNLETNLNKRIDLAKYFQKKLIEIGFEVQESKDNTFTYLSALVPKNINRDEVFNKLRKRGVFCSRIWQNPLFPDLPNTQETAKRIINFPLQNWFTEKDIDKIIVGILSSMD